MEEKNIEVLFNWLDESTEVITKHEDEPYLDGLGVALEVLFYEQATNTMDDELAALMNQSLKNININECSPQEIRKAVQLAIIKGMQRSTQSQHLMTPESIALLMSYFIEKLMSEQTNLRIFDPVVGTGNLLTTVMQRLNNVEAAYGSEVDNTLIQLALYNANLQKLNVELFHQDSLRPFLLDPVDVVVGDLPVGYYPDDIQASNFDLKAKEGHSYAHHLMIEQSLYYTKESGYLFFLVPEFLFDSDQADQLNAFIHKHAHIIGLVRLPETAFSSKNNVKSILILQKKGEQTKDPNEPLLVNMPSLSNVAAMEDITNQMNNWFLSYKNE
ncbi:MAG TPA: class I SAM-dependent methyltransferase [Bacillota bacterium]|nr:class I SAM-dependent methyltransferase [Bacillota bacterium]